MQVFTPAESTPFPGLSERSLTILLFVAGLMVFVAGLSGRDFYGLESRFVLFARDMLRHGMTLFPRVYGRPYPDYPPLGTWLIALGSLPAGRVTLASAVLPSAIAASLNLALLYRVGARISRRLGLFACVFALATMTFVEEARTTSLDHFVALATLVAYLSWCREEGRPRWLLGCLGLALGFAARGPLGVVLPGGIVGAGLAVSRMPRRLVAFAGAAAAVLAAGFGAQLLAAQAAGGDALARAIFEGQFASRMGGRVEPWWYYPSRGVSAYALSFPVALAWVLLSLRERMRWPAAGSASRGQREVLRWVVWAAVVVVLLSIPAAKKARYALAMAPAVSLLAARAMTETSLEPMRRRLRGLVLGVFRLLPFAGLAMVPVGLGISRWLPGAAAGAYAPAAVLLAILGWVVARGWRHHGKGGGGKGRGGAREREPEEPPKKGWMGDPLLAASAGAAAFLVILILLVEPIRASHNHTEPFLRQVESVRGEDGGLAFYRLGPDSTDLTYVANAKAWIQPRFVNDARDLIPTDPPTVYVTTERHFEELSLDPQSMPEIVARGFIGHHACVAFLPRGSARQRPATPRVP